MINARAWRSYAGDRLDSEVSCRRPPSPTSATTCQPVAPQRSAPQRSAPQRSACQRSASQRFASQRFASQGFACQGFALATLLLLFAFALPSANEVAVPVGSRLGHRPAFGPEISRLDVHTQPRRSGGQSGRWQTSQRVRSRMENLHTAPSSNETPHQSIVFWIRVGNTANSLIWSTSRFR